MSRLLDSIKWAERAWQRGKMAPARTGPDADTDTASSGVESQSASHRDTNPEQWPRPDRLAVRTGVDQADNGESSEGLMGGEAPENDSADSNETTALEATAKPQQHASPDRNSTAHSSLVRAEGVAAATARRKAESDRKRKAREESRIQTEPPITTAPLAPVRADRKALSATRAPTRTTVEAPPLLHNL